MAKELPPSIRELLRHRHTCLCLSDSTGSFRWGFFSYKLLPHLTQNDEYGLKGVFKRDCLIIVVPFSKLPNKESVIGVSFSYSDMDKFELPCSCDIYFVNTNYPALDNICLAVYINNGSSNNNSSLVLGNLQKNKFLDIRSVAFVNDAFQMNSASFYKLIEGIQSKQNESPKLKIGYTIINLTGAKTGADSLDTPEIALVQSSKKMGDKAKIPAIEIDYNDGLGIGHISQLFSSNDNFVPQLKAKLIKEIKRLRDDQLRGMEIAVEVAQLTSMNAEEKHANTVKAIKKAISENNLTDTIKFVYPDFLDQLEQLMTQPFYRKEEFIKNWKRNLIMNCDITLKRLDES